MTDLIDLMIRTARLRRQHELADLLQVSPQALSKWKQGRIPAERVLEIERLTGVSRHDLRPDLYPRESRRVEQRAGA